MTKKKKRARLARALRAEGFERVAAFRVAKAVIRAGSPVEVPGTEMEALGLETIFPQSCPCCVPVSEVIGEFGESVTAAWYAIH